MDDEASALPANPMDGTWLEHRWNMVGTWLDHDCNISKMLSMLEHGWNMIGTFRYG